MLPRVGVPNAGIAGVNMNAAKRARISDTDVSRSTTILSAPNPSNAMSVIGTGNNAVYQKYTDPRTQWNFILRPMLKKSGLEVGAVRAHRLTFQTSTREILTDSLIFSYKGQSKIYDDPQLLMRDRRITALGMPQFLWHINERYYDVERPLRLETVFDEWTLTGVMSSHEPLKGANEMTRSAVVISRGDVRITNYWGNNAAPLQHVWLVLKEVKDPQRRPFVLNNAGSVTKSFEQDWTLRLVPYVTDEKKLSAAQLSYKCRDGQTRMGRAIYIGRVIQNNQYDRYSSNVELSERSDNIITTIDMIRQAMAKRIDISLGIEIMQ